MEAAVDVVHLISPAASTTESQSKDYEFSRTSMLEHWAAGVADTQHSFKDPGWLGRTAARKGCTCSTSPAISKPIPRSKRYVHREVKLRVFAKELMTSQSVADLTFGPGKIITSSQTLRSASHDSSRARSPSSPAPRAASVKEIAKRLREAGARVAIADMNPSSRRRPRRIGRRENAMGVGMDVTDEDQVNAAVEQTVKAWGGVDILVSNAGIQIVHPLEEFPFAEWKKMLAIHLDGAFLTTKACLPHMYAVGRADLHGLGALQGGVAAEGAYVAAKHGLIGLAKVIAKEGATHGVRANVICPGFVRTPLVDKQIPSRRRRSASARTRGQEDHAEGDRRRRIHHVEDVADVALFLAAFRPMR